MFSVSKRQIMSNARESLRGLPPIFCIQNPRGLSILTQLRVGLSRLNFHKFKHNFNYTTNPLYPINDGVEDGEHYFLLCHMYDDIRRDLLNGVNAILLPHGMGNLSKDELVNILLYGHESLSFEMNAKILSATLEYILVSNVLNKEVKYSECSSLF